jgi:hypothetical protein
MSVNKSFRQQIINLCLLIGLLGLSSTIYSQTCPPPPGANPIIVENCLQGTDDWQIPMAAGLEPFYQPSLNHEVEGYADKSSVNAGQRIRFHLSSRIQTQPMNIDIYRLGYYSKLGGRLVHTITVASVTPQAFPVPDNTRPALNEETGFGLAACNWPSPFGAFWDVPFEATSGIYIARLTGNTTGHQSYITFAVRRDDLNSDISFQQSVTVYQAYNNYPGLVQLPDTHESNGKSLYPYPLSYGPASSGRSTGPKSFV